MKPLNSRKMLKMGKEEIKFKARIIDVGMDGEGNTYIVINLKGKWAEYYTKLLRGLKDRMREIVIRKY